MTSPGPAQNTLATVFLPTGEVPATLRAVMLMLAGSAFIALSAQIQVPWWPVPMTGQTFAVLLIGVAYGARLGASTLLLYMAEGAMGLPVFAKAGAGLGVLMGPTGGYIMGFVLAAGLIGYLAEQGWDRKVWSMALAMMLGNLVIYMVGLPWLAVYLGSVGVAQPMAAAVAGGLTPFLLGDAIKLALAACLMPITWDLVRRR